MSPLCDFELYNKMEKIRVFASVFFVSMLQWVPFLSCLMSNWKFNIKILFNLNYNGENFMCVLYSCGKILWRWGVLLNKREWKTLTCHDRKSDTSIVSFLSSRNVRWKSSDFLAIISNNNSVEVRSREYVTYTFTFSPLRFQYCSTGTYTPHISVYIYFFSFHSRQSPRWDFLDLAGILIWPFVVSYIKLDKFYIPCVCTH